MSSTVPESWLRDALYDAPHLLLPHIAPRLFGSGEETQRPKSIMRWREYVTSVGRIDLLLAWTGAIVVVECKRGCATEGAVAQVLRYIGALDHATPDGADLLGVVAAEAFDKLAVSAARAAGILLVRLSPAVACSDGFPEREVQVGYDELIRAASWAPPTDRRWRIKAVAALPPGPPPLQSIRCSDVAHVRRSVAAR